MSVGSTGFAVGVDIGGTNMSAALVRLDNDTVAALRTIPTLAANGPDDGMGRLTVLIHSVVRQSGVHWDSISGIGVGCTGPLDLENGLIKNPFTLPTWDDLPIVDILAAAFQKPVLLMNDAHAATLAEHEAGAGRGVLDMVYITVSTGIGGGFILNGRLHRGKLLVAGEIGHQSIAFDGRACYCGRRGCWEMYASGPVIARTAQERVTPDSLIWTLAGGERNAISAGTVGAAAQQGDALAHDILDETGRYLGAGITDLINILAPEVFVLGGGVMQSHGLLLPAIERVVRAQQYAAEYRQIRIVPAHWGRNAGVAGAAFGLLRFLEDRL